MRNTLEQKKQRRKYLLKKGEAYVKAFLVAGIAMACLLFTFSLLGLAITIVSLSIAGDGRDSEGGMTFAITIFLIVCSLAFCIGLLSWKCARSAYQTHQEGRRLPYIPPVTSDTLPAAEVLVRGSVEPTQEQSQILLRGTDGSAGIGEQELLRGSQGQEDRP
ncbi:MAG TPA: hypothetical protein VKU00_30470 [Chthonomonadaceae bacterium]|nr:hypothetical protein [Chthonomonadaceae bacterium]